MATMGANPAGGSKPLRKGGYRPLVKTIDSGIFSLLKTSKHKGTKKRRKK